MQTLFTARQMQVIALQRKGMRKSQIAKALGTSLQNVSMIDKRIRENIALARSTLAFVEDYKQLVVQARKGMQASGAIERVFALADANGIKVRLRSMEVLRMLEAAGIAKNGRIAKNATLALSNDGSVSV
jgi:Tfx family DNA-binding protein